MYALNAHHQKDETERQVKELWVNGFIRYDNNMYSIATYISSHVQ